MGRVPGSVARVLASAIIVAPLAALAWTALVGEADLGGRASLLPTALVVLDPNLSDAIRNSVVVAGVATAGALLVGAWLSRLAWSGPFAGRRLLLLLIAVTAVCPPLLGAIGLRSLFGRMEEWPAFLPAVLADSLPAPSWLALAWVDLAFAMPWIAWRIGAAGDPLSPSLADAARLAGMGPSTAWRRLVWPVVRPGAARAAAVVFSLSIAEPGAPLVLGLRRTLAVQAVEAALRSGPGWAGRSAVLALIATLIAAVVHVLIGWWGGPVVVQQRVEGARRSPPRLGLWVGWATRLGLLPATTLAITPLAGLIWRGGSSPGFSTLRLGEALLESMNDPALGGALLVGLAAALLGLALGWALGRGPVGRGTLAIVLTTPPLAVGIGVGQLARLPSPGGLSGFETWAWGIETLGPRPSHLVPLIVALGLVFCPWGAVAADAVRRRLPAPAFEAARAEGVGLLGRVRACLAITAPVLLLMTCLPLTMAAIGLSPALALDPPERVRAVGVRVVDALDGPDGLRQAARLGLVLVLAGLAITPSLAALQRERRTDLPRL